MLPEPKPERIEYLRSLPAPEAVQLIISGDFVAGEDDYLIEAILKRANVNCDEETMWEILYAAMDEETDPMTVLGRLAQ